MGCGTSTPELAASLSAALAGAPGLALGNVIGSNVANVALILGASAVIAPIMARIGMVAAVALVVATLGMIWVIVLGGIGAALGAIFLGVLAIYLWVSVRRGQTDMPEEVEAASGMLKPLMFVGAGLALLIGGAQALVAGAVDIAQVFSVPPSLDMAEVWALATLGAALLALGLCGRIAGALGVVGYAIYIAVVVA